jgi:hypothetical protein
MRQGSDLTQGPTTVDGSQLSDGLKTRSHIVAVNDLTGSPDVLLRELKRCVTEKRFPLKLTLIHSTVDTYLRGKLRKQRLMLERDPLALTDGNSKHPRFSRLDTMAVGGRGSSDNLGDLLKAMDGDIEPPAQKRALIEQAGDSAQAHEPVQQDRIVSLNDAIINDGGGLGLNDGPSKVKDDALDDRARVNDVSPRSRVRDLQPRKQNGRTNNGGQSAKPGANRVRLETDPAAEAAKRRREQIANLDSFGQPSASSVREQKRAAAAKAETLKDDENF